MPPASRLGGAVLVHRADEAIAAPRQRLHVARIVRVVAQGGAEPLHGRIQAVLEVDERPLRPQPVPQLVTRHDVARTLEHQAEDFERLVLEAHARRSFPQLARTEIQLE